MNALTPEQRAKALIGMDLPFDGYASGFKDNIVVPYLGLPVAAMTPAQREQLIELIALYTDRLPGEHARLRLTEVKQHFDRNDFRMDRRIRSGEPVLLPHLQPGDFHRVLSPARRRVARHRL